MALQEAFERSGLSAKEFLEFHGALFGINLTFEDDEAKVEIKDGRILINGTSIQAQVTGTVRRGSLHIEIGQVSGSGVGVVIGRRR